MFIFGDCHIGSNRRNKWLYKKAIDVWENMVMEVAKNPDNYHSTIVFAGDLWDSDRPTPKDFMVVKNVIDGITGGYNEYLNMVMIPGNHDRVGLDGFCAADVFSDDWEIGSDKKNIVVFDKPFSEWTEYDKSTGKKIQYYFLPYSADILEKLQEISNEAKEYIIKNPDDATVLVSHFTTKEMNPFAGIISEYESVFNPFDLVILGDCHICYDSGKFHTTGSTYMFNVDEMNSKKCIPSYLQVDGLDVKRVTFPELKPKIIDTEDEAVDDNQLYLIVSPEVINVSKPNVFVKYKLNKDNDDSVELNETVEIKSINKDRVFEIMYPDLDESERRLIKMFANYEIEIQDVINNEPMLVVDRTNQLTEVELEAELEGLLNEEDF